VAGLLQKGLWLDSASPVVAELVGHVGFDWALIDWEHGPNDITTLRAQVQALGNTDTPCVVRVPDAQDWMIKQVLDIGVQTVVVPMVNTADQALCMARACRYPPGGTRGMGAALARATDYGLRSDYVATTNDQICCIVQAETVQAFSNLADIAATDGIDGVFIGPADLSADMGHPGNPAHPDVIKAIEDACQTITQAGKYAGIVDFTPEACRHWRDCGFTFLGLGADVSTLMRGLQALRDSL
ncbi:MAG: HpcH/HpaI aldolase/citrate lyase family protein, partial [Pseudomonadota bacterium]